MSDSVSTLDTVSLVSQQLDLNFDYIHRNIRDLSSTAQFQHMSELEELHKMAYTNLKEQMVQGKPLAVDPQLALEAYRTISNVCMQTIEVKRKATETLIKARSIISLPHTRSSNGLIDEEKDTIFDESVSKASINETGIYGDILNNATGSSGV